MPEKYQPAWGTIPPRTTFRETAVDHPSRKYSISLCHSFLSTGYHPRGNVLDLRDIDFTSFLKRVQGFEGSRVPVFQISLDPLNPRSLEPLYSLQLRHPHQAERIGHHYLKRPDQGEPECPEVLILKVNKRGLDI